MHIKLLLLVGLEVLKAEQEDIHLNHMLMELRVLGEIWKNIHLNRLPMGLVY
ncbi:hypothetical protein DPMN_122101 [Dreissena polymorpha]|uniref:Uncharacterized protein n=1 Tax=Dreissena polymorpha TaxID=45954 RepID=A0A9D4JQ32_DREPO|nr:hypothetical protein DPMN_122101 [Dreissena polymorpha]